MPNAICAFKDCSNSTYGLNKWKKRVSQLQSYSCVKVTQKPPEPLSNNTSQLDELSRNNDNEDEDVNLHCDNQESCSSCVRKDVLIRYLNRNRWP